MATRYVWSQDEVEKFQENWNKENQTYEQLAVIYNDHPGFATVKGNQSKIVTKLTNRYESLLIGGADLQTLPDKKRATSNGTVDYKAMNEKARETLSKEQIKKIADKRRELIKRKNERAANA